jgi:hypothetical protein
MQMTCSAILASVTCGMLALCALADATNAQTAGEHRPIARLAALNGELPQREALIGDSPRLEQEERLLAQAARLLTADASGTILAAFDPAAPQGVEAEIAEQYRLELVEWVSRIGLRIVRYRIPDARAPAAVAEALKGDGRIRIVQANLQHRPLPPVPPATTVARRDSGAEAGGKRGGPPSAAAALERKAPGKVETRTRQPAAVAERGRPPDRAPERRRFGGSGALAAGNTASLRFPTADEPFVNR